MILEKSRKINTNNIKYMLKRNIQKNYNVISIFINNEIPSGIQIICLSFNIVIYFYLSYLFPNLMDDK